MNRAERRAQVKYFMHKMHVSKSVAESMIGVGKDQPTPSEEIVTTSTEEVKVEDTNK